jgi:hypothetical protein
MDQLVAQHDIGAHGVGVDLVLGLAGALLQPGMSRSLLKLA